MATVVSGNTVKLNNGQTVQAQEGGWYDGQQFSGGSLGGAGIINNPNQQGYGQAVSKDVVAQTNPNNVSFVQNEQQSTPQFTSLTDVQNHLNDAQNSTFSSYTDPNSPTVETADQIATDLKSGGLLPTGTPPPAPNLAQTYQTLASQAGVDKIQSDITDLKAQQALIADQARINKQAEQNKPVAQNVIEGRISQEAQQAQDQYDFIGRQLTQKTDELNSALTNIKQIMDFTQTDYQNAAAAYDKQFSEAISTINLIHGIQQDQKTDVQKAQDNARANAQILVNTITSGNMNLKNLPADQQAQLNKLEVQAGLPIGFFQSLNVDPKANIISTSTNNGVTQVLIKNPDGTISMQNYGTPGSGVSAKGGITQQTINSSLSNYSWAKDSQGHEISPFMQFVAEYANSMTLDQIYKYYQQSPEGQKFGAPKESRTQIQAIYDSARGNS